MLRILVSTIVCATCFAHSVSAEEAKWNPLLSQAALKLWKPVQGYEYKKAGKPTITAKTLVIPAGEPATGLRYTGKFPVTNYDLQLQARRTAGSDFFCGLTFPVEKSEVTLILGGWGGGVCGLSCVDGYYAVDNETSLGAEFENGKWYSVLVQVRPKKIRIKLDDKEIIELDTTDRKLAASDEMKPCGPLGIATWKTQGEVREIRYRAAN